ncbi:MULTISPECIES: cation:proton antiporter [unclassified Coleofasciculus]|uniref:cation:proton antiporter domain-containing protein n=1 Tax=unclassified Coleofasciculus TaxID=2692782 RepID=UPI0018802314|nr:MULTISPECIES: cation:proton antiporter [unclassified Coleofasciculus]MBE9127725.1 cation:proton antiporter [Coleofasciculus sp. LEGE 07081]MBE9149685.1 cation:proton antiporter [Coleofasciculus sp. LEGE 07092]
MNSLNELNIVITAIGAIVLVLGLVSDYFRRHWWTSDPLTALVMGILLGPVVLDLVNPGGWGIPQEHLLEQTARLTLAIGLMGVALRVPQGYFFRNWKPLAVLLGLVMPIMWVVSGLLVYWILGIPFWEAMLVGAAITPTDPIVSTSIVTGVVAEDYLPKRIRHIISAESGANDGLAYPLVLLCVLMLERSPTEALPHWFVHVVLWEVCGAVLFGVLLGYVAGRLLKWAERKKTIERSSFLGYTIALSLTVLGAGKLIGTDGILAVFAAGLAFGNVIGGKERAEEDNVQEAINRFFTLPIFILLGLMIPWQKWWSLLGWWNILLVVAVLFLRRLPALLLLHQFIKPIKNIPEALFVGWFGPIGVAAIFYAGYSLRRVGVEEVWLVCSLMICASIVAQGLSATPLTKLYGKHFNKKKQSNCENQ